MTDLLDANVLIALAVEDHVHHDAAEEWFAATGPRREFWPDGLGYGEASMYGVLGHRQVTDAYLAALTRAYSGRLATFDRGLAALHPDVTVLVPSVSPLPEQRGTVKPAEE